MCEHQLTPEELFCLEGCRTFPQYELMRQHFEAEHCAFCFLDPEKNVVLWEDQYASAWSVHPTLKQKGLHEHLIIIPKRHVRFEHDLTDVEVLSMHHATKYLASQFPLPGGICATRFGDMRLNAGTVTHLHKNIMVPNGIDEVRVPVFKTPTDRELNVARAKAFAMHYEATMQV